MVEPLSEIEGKYEILDKLQVGGMGAIYKVRHRLLGDERVVKVMRPQLVHDPELQRRFHREARAATRLTHPNIARLYDFSVDDDGAAYIVMEFIAGWTLDDLIAQGEPPPLGLALEIAGQSLKAIGHLHARGVIHRDISPDNLMLTADVDGRAAVKLIDLGLVKSLATSGDLTATGVFVGKFRYASPEQFGRGDAPGPASDLYSFGLVLYELLTGRYPIVGKSASSLIAGHLFREPLAFAETDPDGRVPEDLRRVVMQALAKEPEQRPASAEAFAAALAPIRRRHALDDDATRELLERIRQPPPEPRGRPPSRGSTQSRFDRQFGTEPTPPPADATEMEDARSWVRRIEDKVAASDLDGAREELRLASRTAGRTEELEELEERIAVIEEIMGPAARAPEEPQEAEEAPVEVPEAASPVETAPGRPAAPSQARQVEAELVEVEALRAAGRHDKALALARTLRERAPRHKLVKQIVRELEQALAEAPKTDAPKAATPEAGPTQMLETVRSQVAEELTRPAGDRRSSRRRADEMVAKARELARADDFTAARDLLRRALELWPDHPEGLALRISVETCVEVEEEERRSEAELESSVRDIRDLVSAGQTSSALHGLEEAARRFGERQELLELREAAEGAATEPVEEAPAEEAPADEAPAEDAPPAAAPPLATHDPGDPAYAATELLPRAGAADDRAAIFATRPLTVVGGARSATPAPPEPPPPEPPPPVAPAPTARRFDEMSLQIPQQRTAGRPLDAGDLPLASAEGDEPEARDGRGGKQGGRWKPGVLWLALAVLLLLVIVSLYL